MSPEAHVDVDAILEALDAESKAVRASKDESATGDGKNLAGLSEERKDQEFDPGMDDSFFTNILDDLGSSIADMQASLSDSKHNIGKDESKPAIPVASLPVADESIVNEAQDEGAADEQPVVITPGDVGGAVREHAKSGRKFGLGGLLAGIKGLRKKVEDKMTKSWEDHEARREANANAQVRVAEEPSAAVEENKVKKSEHSKKPSLRKKRKEREGLQDKAVALAQRLEVATGLDKERLQAEYNALITKLKENQADIEQYTSGVAWQSMVLTIGASAVARYGLIGLLGPLVAAPAAGVIAGARDAIRARGEGGATRLYQAATQDTLAALTTGRGSERKGHESEAEYQKNRWQGWKRSPLWLLRKVGAVANDPRARLVQGAYGVTRDRSTLSKFADGNEWDDITALNETAVTGWVNDTLDTNPQLVMELGRRLNRLAALTEYGALDTAGERGSFLSKVSQDHDAAFLEALHAELDAGVRAVIGTKNEEKWQKFLTKWNEHAGYQSAEARKRAERSAKIKGVTASAVGTMMTAGVGSVLAYFVFGDGIQDVQRGVDQVQAAMKDDLNDLQNAIRLSGGHLPPELQAQLPWFNGHPLGDPGIVPPAMGSGQLSPVVDHLQAPWPHDPQMDVPVSVAQPVIAHTQPGTWDQNWTNVTQHVDTAPIGPQQQGVVDRLHQSYLEMQEHARQAKDSADAAAQQVADHQAQMRADTADIPSHGVDYVPQPTVHTQVVELKTGVPWNDIKQVVSESGVTNDGQVASNTITDGLKDFWKALQPKGFNFNAINPHAKFLSLDGVKHVSELPPLSDGAVGYHLSDSQLTHLAEWWKEAAQVEHPTDLQQIARDLNGLETGQPMLFDELAKNPRAMQQLLDIANGVPPVAEIVK